MRVKFTQYVRLLLIVSGLFLFQTQLKAQQAITTIELKNGEKVSGTILEAVPDQYLKIELADKTVRTIPAADVKAIQTVEQKKKKEKNDKVSVMGSVNVGYDLGSKRGYVVVEPRLVVGGKIKDIRVGAGISYLFGASTTEPKQNADKPVLKVPFQHMLPVFANVHADFTKKKIQPSIDFSLGYPAQFFNSAEQSYTTYFSFDYNDYVQYYNVGRISTLGKLYSSLAVGVTFKAGDKVLINPALNYNFIWYAEKMKGYKSGLYYDNGAYYNSYDEEFSYAVERLMQNVGVSINFIY